MLFLVINFAADLLIKYGKGNSSVDALALLNINKKLSFAYWDHKKGAYTYNNFFIMDIY